MEIYQNIIGQIICSVVGGAVGSLCTIWYERRKEKRIEKSECKPIFYRIDPMQAYDYKSSIDYIINSNKQKNNYKLYGIFKNTDKAIMRVVYVCVNGIKYFPKNGDVIDKDKIFNLHIYLDEKLEEKDKVELVIKDILGNEYKYEFEFSLNNERKNANITKIIEKE